MLLTQRLSLSALFLCLPTFADPLNGGLDLGTSTSGSYEARNVFVQPAALGFDTALNGADLTSSLSLGTHASARDDFNFAVAWGPVGFGAERFAAAGWSRFQFAVGTPLTSRLFIGTRLALSRYDTGGSMDAWDFGLQYRTSRYVSFGLLLNQLNQPVLAGVTQPVLSTAAITLRPVPQLDLTLDATTPSNAFFKSASAQAMVGWNPVEGVKLRIGYHTAYQWVAGLQMHFGNASVFSAVAPTSDRKFVIGFQSGTKPYATVVAPPHKAKLTLGSSLSDEKSAGGLLSSARPSLLDLLQDLEEVERDPATRGLVLKLEAFPLGIASAGEVHHAIARVRKAGKKVSVYLGSAGIKEYLIASAADRIYLEPAGEIRWLGLRSERYFLKGTLDKIGVEAEFLAAGKFKSAPEMFTRKDSSESARTAALEELKSLETTLIEYLSKSRSIDAEKWKKLLALGLLSAEEAKKEKLVDDFGSYTTLLTAKDKSDWYLPISHRRSEALALPPRIAVVVASGNILPNRMLWLSLGGTEQVTPASMQDKLQQAEDDPRSQAIVLRISSPGGEVLASQQIATQVEQLTKRVTVSMGDVAASGGYYIAAPGQRIFASPLSVTGSIGVFLGKFNMGGLFGKIDLHKEVLTEAPYPGLYSEDRAWTKAERAVMVRRLQSYYDSFLSYVANKRKMDKAKVGDAAQGRVWTGKQALANGLVDDSGGYYEAIRRAAADAGLQPGQYEPYEIESSSGLFGVMREVALSGVLASPTQEPWTLLLSPKGRRDFLWLSTLRESPFLYLSPVTPPDA